MSDTKWRLQSLQSLPGDFFPKQLLVLPSKLCTQAVVQLNQWHLRIPSEAFCCSLAELKIYSDLKKLFNQTTRRVG